MASHPIVRSGLARLVAERPDLEIVAEAADPTATTQFMGDEPPDALLCASNGGTDEILAIARLGAELSAPIVLIGDDSGASLISLAAAGISGYLLPDATASQIAAALQAVSTGLLVCGVPPLSPTPAAGAQEPRREDDPLTDREMQVLQLVARGLPNKGIARRLSISEHTVKFHVGSILSKLGAASRTEAVTQAAHRGLLTL